MSLAGGTIVLACPGHVSGSLRGLFTVNPHTGELTLLADGDKLRAPWDVEALPGGRLLVADPLAFGDGGLIAVDPTTGRQDRVWSSAEFRSPMAVARERDGRVVVGCSAVNPIDGSPSGVPRGVVVRVNPATGESHEVVPGFDFGTTAGIAVDVGTGRVFTVDPLDFSGNQNRVLVIAEGHAGVRLDMPGFRFSGIAVERSGQLVIPSDDPTQGRLYRVDPLSGPAIGFLGLRGPTGAITTEADTTILLQEHHTLLRVNPVTGARTALAGVAGVMGLTVWP